MFCDSIKNFHSNPEQEAMTATVEEFIFYVNTSEVDKALGLFTEDAVAMPPGAPALIGKQGNVGLIVPLQN